MAVTGFDSVLANRAQMCTRDIQIADCHEEKNRTADCHEEKNHRADCHKENNPKADCHSQKSKFESGLPRVPDPKNFIS
jgi:hypothetical protein